MVSGILCKRAGGRHSRSYRASANATVDFERRWWYEIEQAVAVPCRFQRRRNFFPISRPLYPNGSESLMKLMNDKDLIRDFAATRSEQAFRRLVDRHCDFVYSVAGRVTRDAELARDVSQQVFSKLAAKPNSVPAGVPLVAWLHRTCRSLAIDVVRSEEACRKREAALFHPSAMNSETTPDWSRLEPVIDSLIDQLPELDRRAVVLRFYEKRSHGAIGAALGLSEEAARKRLERALERLRGLLAKRGIATTYAALATILPAHAISPAPTGLAASLSSTALSTATVTTISATTIIAIIMKNKAILAGASLLLFAGAALVAVPQVSQNKPGAAPGAASSPEDFKRSESDLPAASAAMYRRTEANERLNEKYGDSRTKLSKHLVGEFTVVMEEVTSAMEIMARMGMGNRMGEDPAELLGDAGEGLTLTEEQKKKIAELDAERMKHRRESIRARIAAIKKQPAELIEKFLARDAVKRGAMTRGEYDQLTESFKLGDLEAFDINGNALDDQLFVNGMLAILDEEQARLFQEGLATRSPEEAKEAEEKFVTLEEFEEKVRSRRKMSQGMLQLIEGVTEEVTEEE
ncbi:sigma-70 family RNA polymerase sigma factor [Luteolibacter arcticus]|uniref:Sigma-70 family RNA polymerase sigma factor n=1 Tax=Luteolibacter arcticus TaxID=1581411 RepID=A0ABT3GNF1_9BACT|nr:sigma-70 family RNA polymerase sigma factor [Luteolibacter arcticus]MCW1925023.1 sigma-70 family RNA polymerase sigma factor [Luteolibacter arcticus]